MYRLSDHKNKLYYQWKDYDKDIKGVDWLEFDHVIGIYRGSLGMATHISNIRNIPMSIVGFQTRDGEDKSPYWIHNTTQKNNQSYAEGSKILIVDDIYDTGTTMKKVIEFVKKERTKPSPMPQIMTYCLFGKDAPEGTNLVYSNLHDGSWVVFPWER
jgi:hypoxanthine phosphoribosyltransferase